MNKIFLFLTCFSAIFAAPPRTIPLHLQNAFTENGKIALRSRYFDGTKESNKNDYIWKKSLIDDMIHMAHAKKRLYYGKTDMYLYAVLDKYISNIKGKEVAIVGSLTPWYECIILAYGGKPTTIEFNEIDCEDPRITTYTVEEFKQIDKKFDAVISISSIEHSGLGRYGEELDPYGDYKAMDSFVNLLKEDGIMILAIPIGKDAIEFNAHRIYGVHRLRKLFSKWKIIDSEGYQFKQLHYPRYRGHQPVFVLKPKKEA